MKHRGPRLMRESNRRETSGRLVDLSGYKVARAQSMTCDFTVHMPRVRRKETPAAILFYRRRANLCGSLRPGSTLTVWHETVRK
jgi:hypothetical protein